ncbi:helix-hairpin-helix domain-containing protein [Bacillus sp. REN3]|uniref:helix-hairpin-helix domain-containing protein n=1 Tax=Bacillus sp. REN3 TaxID=2802440 RepID=UPI001AEE7383|nr:helix-hairpin-helix domain-containing protein [Bacillus sp. REN3]
MDWIKEHKFYLLAGFAAVAFFFYSSLTPGRDLAQMEEIAPITGEAVAGPPAERAAAENEPVTMMADIKGAVVHPGVYEIADGSRIIDLIEIAGGLSKEADTSTINFAMHVNDEMSVYIPRKGEEAVNPIDSQAAPQPGKKQTVNLNRASANELETLPGIGPSKAAAIIEYRETNGNFKTVDDLKSISGIGDKTFEKLKDSISVN